MDILNEGKYYRDVFLSHAGTDKKKYIQPFIGVLEEREISYWLDEAEISWGSSLLNQLSEGMLKSRFVIVFISDEFLSRNWPQAELRTTLNEEISTGELKVLPVLICDTDNCFKLHPFLRDKKYIRWDEDIIRMVEELEKSLDRTYSNKWSFSHPKDFRGHVWIKIMPKSENKKKIHEFLINWGRWQYQGKLDFQDSSSVILDFAKIAEKKSWPIKFNISPSAFVISGRGNPVININKGWKCMDKTGMGKALLNRRFQSFLSDTDKGNKLIK